MLRDGADDVDLWAMAAELERQFAGYKQRLAGRRNIMAGGDAPEDDVVVVGASYAAGDGDGDDGGGGSSGTHGEGGAGDDACGDGGGDVRGRMYEAYTRRRDERLRSGWRARMERKEAEVMALWAQLGRASNGGGEETTSTGGARKTTAGEQEAEENGEVRRRNSDVVAPPPRRISGKKHARARSFSSTNLLKSSRPDVDGRRRALSQDPPSPSRKPADAHRGRAVGGVGAGAAAPRRKALVSGSKGSAKEHGSLKHAAGGPKPPRSLPRRCSSGGLLEGLEREAAPVRMSCSSDRGAAGRGEARAASPSRLLLGSGNGGTTGAASTRDGAALDSDHGEVVDSVAAASADGCEAEAKNVDVEEIKRDDEETTASPGKLGNGEITSDSETEPTYVYIKKKVVVDEESSETLAAGSDAKSHLDQGKNGTGSADESTTAATADGADTAEECATTNAEEAPARESSDESSFSGRCSPPNSAPSCSSRPAQPIEALLEADAALLRKKHDESAMAVSTPGSAGSRVSGTTQASSSPRSETTPRGFKKRFLSFGKKNKGREPATAIDCTSPSAVDDDGGSARWQSADSTKPRVGSSDAASDDTEHGYAASPKACSLQSLVAASPAKSELGEIVQREKSPKVHRSFFSLRSFNCGRAAD